MQEEHPRAAIQRILLLTTVVLVLLPVVVQPASCVISLEERFDGPIDWEDHTGSAFSFSISGGVGRIIERGGQRGDHYISKEISLLGVRSPHIELDWRSEADPWKYTLGRVDFCDPGTSENLGYIVLANGKCRDFGWSHELSDITQIVGDRLSIELRLTLHDSWTDDHDQEFWFDNVVVWGMPHVSGIPDIELEPGSRSRKIALDDFVTDISCEESEIEWSISGNEMIGVEFDEASRLLHFLSEGDWTGSETITITARSPDGLQGS